MKRVTRNEVKRLTTDVNTKLIIDGLWRDHVWLRDEFLLAPGDRDKTDTEDVAFDPRYVFTQNTYREGGSLVHSWATGEGFGHTINADFAQVHGFGNTANSFFETIFGPYSMPGENQTPDAWINTDLLFVFGNGSGAGENPNSNALEIFKSGLIKSYNAYVVGAFYHQNGEVPGTPEIGTIQYTAENGFEGYHINEWIPLGGGGAGHAPVTLAEGHAAALTLDGQVLNLDLSGYSTTNHTHDYAATNHAHSFLSLTDTIDAYEDELGNTYHQSGVIVSPWGDSVIFTHVFGAHLQSGDEFFWIKNSCPDNLLPQGYYSLVGYLFSPNIENALPSAFTVIWSDTCAYIGRGAGLIAVETEGNTVFTPDGFVNLNDGEDNTGLGYGVGNSVFSSSGNLLLGQGADIDDDGLDGYLCIALSGLPTIRGYSDEIEFAGTITINADDEFNLMTLPTTPVPCWWNSQGFHNSVVFATDNHQLGYSPYSMPVDAPSVANSMILWDEHGLASWGVYSSHSPVTLAQGHAAALTLDGQVINLDLTGYSQTNHTHNYAATDHSHSFLSLTDTFDAYPGSGNMIIAGADSVAYSSLFGNDATGVWAKVEGDTETIGAEIIIHGDISAGDEEYWTLGLNWYFDDTYGCIGTQYETTEPFSQSISIESGATYTFRITFYGRKLEGHGGSINDLIIKIGTQTIKTFTNINPNILFDETFEFVASVNGSQSLEVYTTLDEDPTYFQTWIEVRSLSLKKVTRTFGQGLRFVDENMADLYRLPTSLGNIGDAIILGEGGICQFLPYAGLPAGEDGDILYYNNGWKNLGIGASGSLVKSVNGAPTWHALSEIDDLLFRSEFSDNGYLRRTVSFGDVLFTTDDTVINGDYFTENGFMIRTAEGVYGIATDVVVDGDFTSNGLMKRTAAGTYAIVTDNSATWNTLASLGTKIFWNGSAAQYTAIGVGNYDANTIYFVNV
jgi:hypothetical protein